MEKASNVRDINFEAYFWGPKGENGDFYRTMLMSVLNDHLAWRKSFHNNDKVDFITKVDQSRPDFIKSQQLIKTKLEQLGNLLKKSQPFFSPRYIGHMNWEVMAAAILASFSASLYNPNNVAKAGGTATSVLELEVGHDFSRLFGYDPDKAWGHICAGGTIANMEALWIARNMKVIPVILRELLNEFKIKKNQPIQLPNGGKVDLLGEKEENLINKFNPGDILFLQESVISSLNKVFHYEEVADKMDQISMQTRGLIWRGRGIDVGVVFMPQTKHYSLKKAMDLLAIGAENIRFVPVNKEFRMDMDVLQALLLAEKRPILAVVGVAGSTEESSVDEIHRIVELRNDLKSRKNKGFHIHVDAAYGGYARALFLDEKNRFMDRKHLDNKLKKFKIIGDKPERQYASWPHETVFKAYEAFPLVDTITVDPHKLGYVPYPAGGIALRDKRMREAIQSFAPYVFEKPSPGVPDDLIGSYILEGSKPGAAAAAVWMAHRIMPLNITGYGKLIGETIDGAQALWHGLANAEPFKLKKGLTIHVYPIVKPDINIVNYVFNLNDNKDLARMNRLTDFVATRILGHIPTKNSNMATKEYIASSTSFTCDEYSDSPLPFLEEIGFDKTEWRRVQKLKVIRSVIMSPYLTLDYVDQNYVVNFISYLQRQLVKHTREITKLLSQ